MNLTDALPGLPSLSDSTANNSQTSASVTDTASKVAGAVINGASSAMFGGMTIQRITIIVLGLLLIAAGIFAFKPVHETVISTAKEGAAAAALA